MVGYVRWASMSVSYTKLGVYTMTNAHPLSLRCIIVVALSYISAQGLRIDIGMPLFSPNLNYKKQTPKIHFGLDRGV
jgi:hypothetical protein